MTIESLAESFREAKAKAGHPARIKYPKKLRDAAIEYFKANPGLTPSRMASRIGISTSCADKWFKSVKQARAKDKIKTDLPNFVELKPKQNSDWTVANDGELRVRIIEVSIPAALGEAELFSSLRAIVHGAV
ncbi:MAG TPA: hypothetical protein VE954_24065 [Oligoflexus sp.]|uniref:hypothetical protein n=1 Tax=Oligoflexus sp. TaxID=1971216 RepID=UPI002D3599C9|nr:hypothetical protein [Oligoflexus sp.]HYX36190.1 hypothetical protein [Oligoflexus sp.]